MLPRKIFKKLKDQAKDKKIALLLGARQVGKTTLLKELYLELSESNRCLFLDLDIISNYEKVGTFENLINTIKLNGYKEEQKEFFYLFLDEFQRYPALAKIMKNVYDNFNNVKIYASGSSSLAIKSQIQESLAGRKKINVIFPLDFEEFLWFKQNDKLLNKFQNIKGLKGENLHSSLKEFNDLLKEFLIFGGYPEVVLKISKQEKIDVLSGIFDLYVKKDLVEYLNIERILEMKKLIEFLAINNGKKIKYEEISSLTSLKFNETKRYLEILRETYMVEILRPFYTNKNKELVKIPKIYFIDNGVRNFFINNFNELSLRDDSGFLFEGFVLSEFLKKGAKNIRFWQDKNGHEVDMLLEENSVLIPIEVKFKQSLKSEDFRGTNAFLNDYPKTKKSYLINFGSQKTSGNTHLILPYSLGKIILNNAN
ncbi:MAG: ATP-binding protein [Candidatus Woesearchaeota archaeon]|nr:ATP-binding protein [Candidatus Woesearchaeota archaeon]